MTDSLFDLLDEVPDWVHLREPETNEFRWWRFHLAHPQVGRELIHLARMWRRFGDDPCSVKYLCGKLHDEQRRVPVEDRLPDVSNTHTAFYGRWMVEVAPDLDGVFEFRKQRSAA